MHYFVPFVLLFGYLSMRVRHDGDFGMVMPVVFVLLAVWSFAGMLRHGARITRASVPMVFLLGVGALGVFAQFSVVVYDALGPQVLGAPVALAVVWASLVLGAGAVALRITRSWVWGLCYAAAGAMVWSLVVDPALFHLGLFSYRATGIYYGIPFAQTAFWGCSTVVGVALVWWSTGRKESALPLGTIVGPLLLLTYATGVCVATGAWIPAVIGLLLVQVGFRSMHYL